MISMTRIEAIRILSRYDTEHYTPQHRMAHRMAIAIMMEQMEQGNDFDKENYNEGNKSCCDKI